MLLSVFTLCIATFAPLALAAGRLHGLDLAEAISASTIDSMKADMVSPKHIIDGVMSYKRRALVFLRLELRHFVSRLDRIQDTFGS